jgi:hypothetical protein
MFTPDDTKLRVICMALCSPTSRVDLLAILSPTISTSSILEKEPKLGATLSWNSGTAIFIVRPPLAVLSIISLRSENSVGAHMRRLTSRI